jgi:hypothetical protein
MRRRLIALRRNVQRYSKYPGALLIIVGVALMAGQVRILQRVKRHADMCRIFVICSIIAAMTGAAALFARVDGVPFPLLPYRMRRRMARTARRLRVFALRDGGLRHQQNQPANRQYDEGPDQHSSRDFLGRHVSLLAGDPRLLFRLWLLYGEMTFGWAIA